MATMTDKVALVTGANSGLGKATALGLARLGATVIMVCRDRSRGEAAKAEIIAASGNASVDLLLADLSSQQAIRQLAQDFKAKYARLHLLINNAGGVFYTRSTSADGLEYSLAFNHLAPFLLTNLLLDTLKASAPARIINVTTRPFRNSYLHFDDLQFEKRRYNGMQAYSESKLGNILFTYELARRLEGTEVTVNCVHPGVFKSNFGQSATGQPLMFRLMMPLFRPFMAEADRAAERVLYLATSPEMEGVSGKYIADKKEIASPPQSYDREANRQLWEVSSALTGLA